MGIIVPLVYWKPGEGREHRANRPVVVEVNEERDLDCEVPYPLSHYVLGLISYRLTVGLERCDLSSFDLVS